MHFFTKTVQLRNPLHKKYMIVVGKKSLTQGSETRINAKPALM